MNHLEAVQQKIMPLQDLLRLRNIWHFKSEPVVFTNGCFDLLHKGHIHSLTEAVSFGKHLVIGLNSDESIRRIKKDGRPIQDQTSRALVLAALSCTDAIIIFNEDTPLELIRAIKPEVLVKGGDYTRETIIGAEDVLANGGRIEIIKLIEGYSTTAIEQKITGHK
ncbi:MAG: D-glycero-beta-D-manno-heptose 1-phosphate adenylyltransferase [Bacteroidetes bacterium]|nr:D-glycero-beta-D-manno-heptose 1-phosphate adenylyltransferase [Bacteroidota bacterium]